MIARNPTDANPQKTRLYTNLTNSHLRSNLETLLDGQPMLEFLHRRVAADHTVDPVLSNAIAKHILTYLKACDLQSGAAVRMYEEFIRGYNKDIERFAETGLYPTELDGDVRQISRLEYDVALLLSCLASPHRYRIMQLLVENTLSGSALFIGCGPGLEIALLEDKFSLIHAFDLELNSVLPEIFSNVSFFQEMFPSPNAAKEYESIYLIEILEHLEHPFDLVKDCVDALADNGRLILTTATDIPQFDHLYNFEFDHSRFESKMKSIGIKPVMAEQINHNYLPVNKPSGMRAKNHFYVFERVS